MIDAHEYHARLDRCLDERRDPLDDEELVQFLDAHPEMLDKFADRRADLRALASLPAPVEPRVAPRHPSHRLPMLAVAAAALVVGFCISQLLNGSTTTGDNGNSKVPAVGQTTSNEQPTRQRRGRILSASLREVEPRLRAAANYTLHEPLVQTKTMTLEAYEQRSELR